MTKSSIIQNVLLQFDLRPDEIQSLGNAGGFSGSSIYKIVDSKQMYCLKAWPESTALEKLDWIHRVLRFAAANGCSELVTPISLSNGNTFVQAGKSIWELTRWVGGRAIAQLEPNDDRIDASLNFLARFHQATSRYYFNFLPSKNVEIAISRLHQFDSIIDQSRIAQKQPRSIFKDHDWNQLDQFGGALATRLKRELGTFRELPVPVHPVIRDLRAEHLFFEQSRLIAVIDFGAMSVDSAACDLARLLGDLTAYDAQKMAAGMEIYHRIRPLNEIERSLVLVLAKTTVMVGLLNWINWLLIERRNFDDEFLVQKRIDSLFDHFHKLREDWKVN